MSGTILLGKKIVGVMPPSVQKVYSTLQGKQLHVGDIESKTKYSPRTVRQALRHLKRTGLITQIPDMMDMRRHYYTAVSA